MVCFLVLVDIIANNSSYGYVSFHARKTSLTRIDNADLLFIKEGLDLILPKLATIIHKLSAFAVEYKDMPTLGYTHYQYGSCRIGESILIC